MSTANHIKNINRAVILGGGISGLGAALLAQKHGYDVFLSDKGVMKDAFAKAL
ncbi:MAG: NAD(P)-binding protein, partial [Nonlabens sp.]|nr:NAD(P)-binding protein [Nonlabens sp.]